MATQNQVNIGVNVSDNGTAKKTVKNFDEITASANRAQKAAAGINTPAPVRAGLAPGGTSGSRKASEPSGSQQMMSEQQYGQLRGSAGATGASARDFANQAQGLGGLVRIYATFAANLFAVSAAFTALSNAMDTSNMVKGLEQLGAQGGRNLGALSKRVVELTDGAVNLREAMSATAQATSAGLSGKNLERLAVVAKTASQTLGISMPDALNRLSRGITKLEPELLDELGLFVKIDDAVGIYARSVGKSANQLTEFERRHAFALATLEQGEKKFGDIQIDSNPYSKLLASVTNLSQKILETVNVALGPLVELLSQSPKALGLAIAGIAAILLKQAIPALGMYRENARMMAEETRQRVLKSVQDQQAAASQLDTIAAMRAEKEFQTEKSTQERIAKLQKSRFNQDLLGKDLRTSLKKSAFDVTPEETSTLKARSQALLDSDNETQKKQGAKLQAHLAKMEALRNESAARGDAAAAASEARDSKWYSHQQQMAKNLEKLNRDATKRAMLSGVADTAAVLGPVAAFRQLSIETKKLDAGPAAKTFAALQGSLTIASSAAVTALNAFGGWVALFGMLAGVISTVVGWLSETKKESAATAQAFDSVNSSVDNVTRTLEAMAKKTPLEQISVAAIMARATAFGELAESIELANTRAIAELAKMGGTDKFVDWVSKLWSGDVQSKLNKVTAEGFASAFTAMERGPVSDKLRESFKSLLGVDSVDAASLEAALEKLPEDIKKIRLATLTKDLKEAGLAAQVTAAKGKELTDAYAESAKQFQDLRNSFLPTDAVTKLGMTIIADANKLSVALKDPVQTLNAMNAAVRDSNSLSLFPTETANVLVGLRGKIEDLTKSYADANNEVSEIEKKIGEFNSKKANTLNWTDSEHKRKTLIGINEELSKLRGQKEIKTKLLYDVQAQTQTLGKQFDAVLKDQFAYGAKLLSDKLSGEWAKAGSTIGSAIAGMLGDSEAGIKMRTKYELAGLNAQREQIKTQIELIKSNERLAIAIEQDSLDRQKAAVGPNADARDLRPINDRQMALDRRREIVDGKVGKGSTAKLAQDIEKGVLGAQESLSYVQAAEGAFATMANITAQMGVTSIKAAVDSSKLAMKTEQEKIDAEAERLRLSKESLSNIESIAGSESLLLQSQKQANDQAQLRYETDKKSYELRVLLGALEVLQKSAIEDADKALIANDITKTKNKITELETAGKISKTNLDNKQIVEKTSLAYILEAKEQEKLYVKLQETQALESDRLGMLDSQLENYKQLGAIGEQEYLRAKLLLDNDKARLETQTKIDQIRKGGNTAIAGAEQVIAQSEEAKKTATPEAQAILNEKIREQRQLIDDTNKSGDAQVQSLIAQLGLRTQINTVMSEQAIAMEKVNAATQNLAVLFGELGTKIGNTVGELVKYSMGSDAMAKRHEDSLKSMTKGTDEYSNKVAKNAEEREKYEITGQMKAAGVAKSLFKEKTAAYKVLNNLEKIRAAQSIALSVKEAAVKLGLITEVQIANFAASAKELAMKANTALVSIGIDIPKIYAATIGQLGIFGPPVAAAMIAAFVGRGGGGGAAFVPTSEQRQETQGTAMGYDSTGAKVQTRRGVFGDTEAKSESIVKSLEVIRDNSVEGLNYDNKMLRALENLNNALDETAKGLYKVTGLRAGSLSGVVEGTNTGGGLLGIGGLFSKSVTKDVIDSGIQLKGTFYDLIKGMQGTINTFETVSTTVKKSGFFGIGGSTKTSVSTEYKDLLGVDEKAFKAISAAFGYAGDLLYQIADTAGIASTVVDEAIRKVPVDEMVSLRGLSGEEFTKELSAVIGAVLDDTALAVFSTFEQYAKFGEGMLETVVRVIDTNTKVEQAVSNMGVNVDLTKLYGVTEALANAAGGLDKFIDKAKFFAENFLTEAERLAPKQMAVAKELGRIARLGYTSADGIVNTREEFKLLVQSLDLTTESGREAYTALMNIGEDFIAITPEIKSASLSIEEFNNTLKSLKTRILELTGTPSEVLAAQRAEVLSGTDDRLKPLQEYIFALEDVKTAEAALTKARESEVNKLKQQKSTTESTVNSLNNYINSIKKFRESLLLGAQSPLTPAQRYAEAERQFDALLATANGPATTPAEIRTRDLALSQLEGAASSFLEASRIYNASSPQYTSDFSKVQGALSSTESSLTAQLSIEEKSLAELESQTSFLEAQIAATNGVNNSVLSVADAIAGLESAVLRAAALKPAADAVTGAGAGTAGSTTALQTAAVTSGKAIIDNNIVYGAQGSSTTTDAMYSAIKNYVESSVNTTAGAANVSAVTDLYNTMVKTWGLNSQQLAQVMGLTQQEVLDTFVGQYGLPAFARGTNFVPDDMIAQIHQGERIVPAADNAELMASIGNRNRTNEVLAQEIKKLNQEIKVLQKAVVDGAVINAQATDRNTVEISKTVKDTGLTASHTEAIRRRTQIV